MKLIAMYCTGLFLSLTSNTSISQSCACGPTYCTDTSEYKAALSKKKAIATASGYPARLVELYDNLDHCEASITSSPDSFNILHQKNDGTIVVDGWTKENESIDAAAVAAGTMKACYVILARKAFSCCGAVPSEKRPDYLQSLDLNTTATLECEN